MARWTEKQRDTAYRIYVTDALKVIGENTMSFGGGSCMTERYIDLIKNNKVKDDRTGEEIAADFIKRAGLTLKE